jgi:hypothetical protein
MRYKVTADAVRGDQEAEFDSVIEAIESAACLTLSRDFNNIQIKKRRIGDPCARDHRPSTGTPCRAQGCSTLWNGQDFKQVIDARQSGAVAVLAEGAGLA